MEIKIRDYIKSDFTSRSSAREICKDINGDCVLDFSGMDMVSRSFIDELFRVYRLKHRDWNLSYKNCNDYIERLIKGKTIEYDLQVNNSF